MTIDVIDVAGTQTLEIKLHTAGTRWAGRSASTFMINQNERNGGVGNANALVNSVSCFDAYNLTNQTDTGCNTFNDPFTWGIFDITSGGTSNILGGIGNGRPMDFSAYPWEDWAGGVKIQIPINATFAQVANTGELVTPAATWNLLDLSSNVHEIKIRTAQRTDLTALNLLDGYGSATTHYAGIPGVDTPRPVSFCGPTTFTLESGCMDPADSNYNPNAVIDDGSCGVITCPPDPFTGMSTGICIEKSTGSNIYNIN